MAKKITGANLQDHIDSGKPIVIDFWAEWCGPCRMIAPIIEKMAGKYEDRAIIGKCDIEKSNDMAMKFGVRNIPTIIYLENGEVVDKHVGVASAAVLEEKLEKLLLKSSRQEGGDY